MDAVLESVDFLDCRDEVSPMQEIPKDRIAWLASEVKDQHWVVAVDEKALHELQRLGEFVQRNPLQNLQRTIADFELPACEEMMAKMRHILDDGVGFAVLDRLPMDQFDIDVWVEIYWLLGQFVGRPVAQKWNGQMIYDVRDTGTAYGYGVRGSRTNVELVFHVDNAFAKMVPDYVGLFCRNPAKEGGVSRFCSLYMVHQMMQDRFPDSLERLYQPMIFDRQKEHSEHEAKICVAPYFSWKNNRLNARANSSLVRKGYDVVGQKMDAALLAALDAVDEVCASPDIWFEGPLQQGQIQYLNNHEVGHYRSAYVDHDEPEKKRHLFRLWHRERGSATYDGDEFK